jgi:DNA-directed RNA polymerase specialized sigma24 family protein
MKENDERACELLAEIRQGKEESLGEFFDMYGQMVHSTAYRITRSLDDADLLTQNTFLSVWQKAAQFDPAKDSVKLWLTSMAIEFAEAQLASRRQSKGGDDDDDEEPAPAVPRPLHEVVAVSNVAVNPEVRENMLFAVHLARIAENEARAQRELEFPKESPKERGKGSGASGDRKSNVYALGMVFIAVVMVLAFAMFVNSLLKTIDHQKDVVAMQENRIIQLSVDLDMKEEILSILKSPSLRVFPVLSSAPRSPAYGRMFWDQDKGVAALQAFHLPNLPRDKSYQLWFLGESTYFNLGTLSSMNDSTVHFKLTRLDTPSVGENGMVQLTVEPKDGSTKPTGDVVLSGKASRDPYKIATQHN